MAWHWAHAAAGECDTWATAETDWHLRWKARVPPDWCEVIMRKDDEVHIADIRQPSSKLVIEIQHSYLSPENISEREAFYQNMWWIFDVRNCDGFELRQDLSKHSENDPYRTFRWKHARKSLAAPTKRVFLDLGYAIFELKKMYPQTPTGGWGILRTRTQLVAWINEDW